MRFHLEIKWLEPTARGCRRPSPRTTVDLYMTPREPEDYLRRHLRDGRPVLGLVLPFWVVRAAHGQNHFLIGFGSCFWVLFLALALGLTSVPISNGPEKHELSPLLASLSD